jgi:hypothetical protein
LGVLNQDNAVDFISINIEFRYQSFSISGLEINNFEQITSIMLDDELDRPGAQPTGTIK